MPSCSSCAQCLFFFFFFFFFPSIWLSPLCQLPLRWQHVSPGRLKRIKHSAYRDWIVSYYNRHRCTFVVQFSGWFRLRAMWVMLYRFVRRKNGQSWVCQTNVRMSVSSQSTWKSETIEKWNRKTFFLFTGNGRKYRNKGLDVIHVDSVTMLESLVVVTWHRKLTKQKIGRRRKRDIPEKEKWNCT